MGSLHDFLDRVKRTPLVFKPWPIFLCFLFGNTALAYTAWSIHLKLFVGLFFILLPALVAWRLLSDENNAAPPEPALLPDPPLALYLTLGALLLFTQFFRLDQNPFWPLMDCAREVYYGLRLSQAWDGRMLFGEIQDQPLFFWLIAALLKVFPPTLTTFRALPAFLFVLTVVAAYWAARRLLPRGPSLAAAAFFAFSFAPYTISRTQQRTNLALLLECLVLGCLILYFRMDPKSRATPLLLGIALGAGMYTYTSFGALALWASTLLLFDALRRKVFGPMLWVGFVSFLIFLPLLMAYLAPHGHDYYKGHFDISQAGIPFLIGLFWNGLSSVPYGGNWGGWLNPLMTSLIFMGLFWLYQERAKGWVRSLFYAFAVLFLPAAMTADVEMLRLLTLLPLGALCAMLGIVTLVASFRPSRRWVILLCFLSISAGLDAYHYLGPYQKVDHLPVDKRSWRKTAFRDAFLLMRERAAQEGPGLIFHSFLTDYPDRSLEVYTYSFNALQNHRLDPSRARWAAVVCDPNLLPFLMKRFPAGRWVHLGDSSGQYTFGVLPTGSFQGAELRRWIDTHTAIVELDRAALYKPPAETWEILGPPLREAQARLGGDPFLETVYAEIAAQYHSIHRSLPRTLNALEVGLQKGYPSAKLLNEKGCVLFLSGQTDQARICFQSACAAPVNLTNAEKNLATLDLASAAKKAR